MDDIVLANVDHDILERISELASSNNRPVGEEIKALLRKAVETRDPRIRARWLAQRAREIAEMTPKGVVQTDSVVLLREDRDRD